jgi:hypothetical protein
MNMRNILTIAKKDWLEVRQNKYAWAPMLIVPAIFVIIIPLIFTLVIPVLAVSPQDVLTSDADFQVFIDHMPLQLSRYIDSKIRWSPCWSSSWVLCSRPCS